MADLRRGAVEKEVPEAPSAPEWDAARPEIPPPGAAGTSSGAAPVSWLPEGLAGVLSELEGALGSESPLVSRIATLLMGEKLAAKESDTTFADAVERRATGRTAGSSFRAGPDPEAAAVHIPAPEEAAAYDFAASPRRTGPAYRMQRPPTFSGDREDVPRTWIFKVRQYMQLAGVPRRAEVQYAASLLEKAAATWYQDVYESGTVFETFDEFCRTLQHEFAVVNEVDRAREDLHMLRQSASVRVYIAEFRKIALRCRNLQAAEKMFLFKKGLKSNIRLQVELADPADFLHMASVAERADQVTWTARQNDSRHVSRHDSRPRQPRQYDSRPYSQPPRRDSWTGGRNVGSTSRTDSRPRKEMNAVKCHNCGQFGHYANRCTKEIQAPRNPCPKCGKKGHWGWQCKGNLNAMQGEPQQHYHSAAASTMQQSRVQENYRSA